MEMKEPKTTAQPQPPSGGVQPRLFAAAGDMFRCTGWVVETVKRSEQSTNIAQFKSDGNDHIMQTLIHIVYMSEELTSAQSLKMCCPGYEPCCCTRLWLSPSERPCSKAFDLITCAYKINTSDHTQEKQ